MAEKAHITPDVLKWARESAKISIEAAAKKVSVPSEKLADWEAGKGLPTIRQAQKLANVYRRPFAIFFLPEVPRDFYPLQDYRKQGSTPLTTPSIFIIREIQQKQAWISQFFEEQDEPKVPFVGRYSTEDNPKIIAEDILKTLNITPGNYSKGNPLKEWIDSAERNGIFVSRTSFFHSNAVLNSEEIQGFAIADDYAPFVFVNSEDWPAAQLFTLVHELAHIWIAKTGISNEVDSKTDDRDKYHPIELFCNEIAANALMPKDFILQLKKSDFLSSQEVYKASKPLGVSTYALLVRALNLGVITRSTYVSLKKQADVDFQNFLEKEEEKKAKQKLSTSGPSYFLLQLNRNGKLFTQIVLNFFKSGLVEPTVASSLLNVQSNKFSKLEAQILR